MCKKEIKDKNFYFNISSFFSTSLMYIQLKWNDISSFQIKYSYEKASCQVMNLIAIYQFTLFQGMVRDIIKKHREFEKNRWKSLKTYSLSHRDSRLILN